VTRILVIKLGAFGDFAQSFPAFAAIRAHHPGARITLLTTRPFVDLAQASPWFDEVWSDGRPKWRDIGAVWRLAKRLRQGRFDRVYDLQTSGRSSKYRAFVGLRAEWSGIAWGASHRHRNRLRDRMLTVPRQREQLAIAGIREVPPPSLDWLIADVSHLGLPERFCVFVPGTSERQAPKRWPAARYAELARLLPVPAVVVGGPSETAITAEIVRLAPGAIDLSGKKSPPSVLAALARMAEFAVGNDTGPTHLLAALGCPTLAVYGPLTDAEIYAPQGPCVRYVQVPVLADLSAERVREELRGLGVSL
jgi:ADP-heptose:LPS heptosyltransferase